MLASSSSEEELSDTKPYEASDFDSPSSESGLINLTTVGPRLAGFFGVSGVSTSVDIPSESLTEVEAGEVSELDCRA
jgi:hypothetical protein